jgi:hypothetical protein
MPSPLRPLAGENKHYTRRTAGGHPPGGQPWALFAVQEGFQLGRQFGPIGANNGQPMLVMGAANGRCVSHVVQGSAVGLQEMLVGNGRFLQRFWRVGRQNKLVKRLC